MNPLHTGPGMAGVVVFAAVTAFLILLAAFIAATAIIARQSRDHVIPQACRPRNRTAAGQARTAARPQGGTP